MLSASVIRCCSRIRLLATLAAVCVLPGCSSLSALQDADINKYTIERTLASILRYDSPNKTLGIRYMRDDRTAQERYCSNIMRPYAALNIRASDLPNDDTTVITLGKREGALAAETGLGESRYGKSFVSVQTDEQNGGRLAMMTYRLEF